MEVLSIWEVYEMSIYAYQAELSNGESISLEDFKGKVLVIVNTASKCGLTPQYEGLERLFRNYKSIKVFPF